MRTLPMFQARRKNKSAPEVKPLLIDDLIILLKKGLLQRDSISGQYWVKFYNQKTFYEAIDGLKKHGYREHADFVLSNYPYIELTNRSLIQNYKNDSRAEATAMNVKFEPSINLLALLQQGLLQTDSRTGQYWVKFYDPKTFDAAIEGLKKDGYRENAGFGLSDGYPYIELTNSLLIEKRKNLPKEAILAYQAKRTFLCGLFSEKVETKNKPLQKLANNEIFDPTIVKEIFKFL